MNRRKFLGNAAMLGAGLNIFSPQSILGNNTIKTGTDIKPALLGGPQAHPKPFPGWPVFDNSEYKILIDVLHDGKWGRLHGKVSQTFEKEYAKLQGAQHGLVVSSGTAALSTMLGALDIGPGDEVVLPVYTFIATYNVITLNYALPVFADIDIESFQIDPDRMEAAITKQTKALIPVHIGGSPFDVDRVMQIGDKHRVPVIEDACQAHLAAWKGKGVGSFGLGGAFSFQSTKNLNCAEGGAVISNDDSFIRKCYCFHNQGRTANANPFLPGEGTRATNLRLTEFQSAILTAQMARLEEQARKRSENAAYLNLLFDEIAGITPAKLYDGVTNSAYHLYMLRYDPSQFSGMSRERFIQAMKAEGISCDTGYRAMNRESYVTDLAKNKHYLKIYGEKTMKQWLDRNQCPQNDQLVKEALWLSQTMLLGSKDDMEQIAGAIKKIQRYSAQLKT